MSAKYKAIIVDDELHGRENLSVLISENIPQIDIVATAKDAFEAKQLIDTCKPDIVFLDINMGKINGIELLNAYGDKNFEVVFVTAYDTYVIKALKAGATGYILKPIILEELISEVNKVCSLIDLKNKKGKPVKAAVYPDNIIVNHSKGYILIHPQDIIRIEAFGSYCKIYLKGMDEFTTSKTLKAMTKQLNPDMFYRVHKTHIINLNYVKEYKNAGDGAIVLNDGSEVKVAVLKRSDFKQKLVTFMSING